MGRATGEALGRSDATQGKEFGMKNLLFVGAAAGAVVAAAPASAQVYMGADPGDVGVQAGPFAFGVGPGYGWRSPYAYGRYGYGAYGYDYGYSGYMRPGGYANGALGGYIGSTQYRGWGDSASYGRLRHRRPHRLCRPTLAFCEPPPPPPPS